MKRKRTYTTHVARAACVVAMLICTVFANKVNADEDEFTVRVDVKGSCTIDEVDELDFGDLDKAKDSPAEAKGSIKYWCTTDTPYRIEFNNGKYADGSQRRLQNGTNYLNYDFATPTGGDYIGAGQGATPPYEMTATISVDEVKNAVSGEYLDTVTLTINPQ